MSEPIRVVMADDHPIVRAGLAAVLGTAADIEVVAEAASVAEVLAVVNRFAPDLVLLDLNFGSGLTGIDATRELAKQEKPPRVLILTNYDSDADILGAIEAGAAGYLLKDAPPEDLLSAIRQAVRGHTVLGPAVAGRLVARVNEPQQSLSAREIEVLTLASEGQGNRDIGRVLHISETTVKSHLAHIFSKLGVNNRQQAVLAAQRGGFIRRM
ncbi:DNA-binding response regulator [Mycetocola tolaasinivorans]|uniref:DNA-binding response regulator n=1 Tax=Mycetocola tolaasinivorans TaxID=76635 RepID=A0A3L7A5M5_9MICO|nr:response regulator transcription factor [Mycetocola tolaasinivorans]RLP75626.1 DNA-binding response regulator [Mycetocola tolaasinivorans]